MTVKSLQRHFESENNVFSLGKQSFKEIFTKKRI